MRRFSAQRGLEEQQRRDARDDRGELGIVELGHRRQSVAPVIVPSAART